MECHDSTLLSFRDEVGGSGKLPCTSEDEGEIPILILGLILLVFYITVIPLIITITIITLPVRILITILIVNIFIISWHRPIATVTV